MKKIFIEITIIFFSINFQLFAQPYQELVPKFNPRKCPVMIRKINNPTRANLDYAAYHANPVRYDHEKFKPKTPKTDTKLSGINFNGYLADVANTIDKTPLTDAEKQQPLSWNALKNLIWESVKSDIFSQISGAIEGYKWEDPEIFKPYQLITGTWIHEKEQPEIWVRIEFAPWVKFLKEVTDENKDGIQEIYGKINPEKIPVEELSKIISWIKGDYTSKVLNREEVKEWAQVLASYWYPTLNTDIIEAGKDNIWPNEETEKAVRKRVNKISVKDPTVIIRGVPLGKPVYNIFWIPEFPETVSAPPDAASQADISSHSMDTSVSVNFRSNNELLSKQLIKYGTYEKWIEALDPFRKSQTIFVNSLPDKQMGYEGRNGWLFFRRSLEYTLADSLSKQKNDKNPLKHILELKKFLDSHNINFLFVPVPPKTEVYSENLVNSNSPGNTIVNPWGRQIIAELQKNGVEVIDLLPDMLKAKSSDKEHKEYMYQLHDTHWSFRGIKLAAGKIADRIRQYGWYESHNPDTSAYTIADTVFSRRGDIVERLPQNKQPGYMAVNLTGKKVFKDSSPYKGDKDAPVILMGDSFVGVYQLVDCKNAGVGAHIAAKTGVDVDMIVSWGGGPLVRQKVIRQRKELLGQKRLVIYMMAARDLYDYSQLWEPLKTE